MRAANVRKILFSSAAALRIPCRDATTRELALRLRMEPRNLPPVALVKDTPEPTVWIYTFLRYFNASGADPDGNFGEDRRH